MCFHTCVLQAIAFLDLFAISLIVPLLPNHLRAMGGSHIYVGLHGSVYAGFQLGSGPLIGCLSDLKGRKPILLMSLVMSSMAYVLMGVTDSVLAILLIRAYLGIFKQTQLLARSMIPDYEPNPLKQSEIYGKIVASCGLGTSLGPILGGYFVESNPKNGFAFLTVIVSLIFILNASLVFFLLPEIHTRFKKSCKTPCNKGLIYSITSSLKQTINQLCCIRWSLFWDIFLLRGLIAFAMGIYYSNYSIYLSTQFGLSPKYIGYVISFQAVVSSLSCYFIGFLNSFYTRDKDYTQRNLHVFTIMAASFLGLILSYNMYLYILCLTPLAIACSMGRLINIEMALKRGRGENRGTIIGASNSVRSISNVMAPMVGGVIGQFKGVTYVLYASLFAAIFGVIISYKIKLKRFMMG